MKTYRPKTGDVVIWPNGIEVNYDPVSERLVVLATKGKRWVSTSDSNAPEFLFIGAEL